MIKKIKSIIQNNPKKIVGVKENNFTISIIENGKVYETVFEPKDFFELNKLIIEETETRPRVEDRVNYWECFNVDGEYDESVYHGLLELRKNIPARKTNSAPAVNVKAEMSKRIEEIKKDFLSREYYGEFAATQKFNGSKFYEQVERVSKILELDEVSLEAAKVAGYNMQDYCFFIECEAKQVFEYLEGGIGFSLRPIEYRKTRTVNTQRRALKELGGEFDISEHFFQTFLDELKNKQTPLTERERVMVTKAKLLGIW